MEVLESALAEASAELNRQMHRFPWKRDGALAAVTVTPLEGSPSTPAWYERKKGDVSINLLAVYEDDEKMVRHVLRNLAAGHPVPDVILGMLAHETAHSRWSNWTHPEGVTPAEAATMTMFEELRIEKRAADWTDNARTLLRHSFHWLLKRMVLDHIGTDPLSVAHAWALTFGRYTASIASLDEVQPVDDVARTALSDNTVDMLREILEEAIHTDNTDRLCQLACEWLALLKSEDDEAPTMTLYLHGEPDGDADGEAPGDSELAEVLSQSIAEVAASIDESPTPPERESDMADPMKMASKVFGHGDGKSSHKQEWHERDPSPDLRSEALRFSRTLEALSLPSVSLRHYPGTLPPGRLRGREMVRQGAERSMGMMSTATPWERAKRMRSHTKPIIVGCMTDTSGSMSWAEDFVADFAWMMAVAGQRVGARTAAVTFGNNAEMVTRPHEVPQKVRVRQANGSHEKFDHAAAAMEGVLHLSVPTNAAKVLFIVSDGHLVIDGEKGRARRWLERWTRGGTLVVWLGCEGYNWPELSGDARKPGEAVNVPMTYLSYESAVHDMERVVVAAARGMS